MILLDTNVLSELMKTHPNEGVLAWVNEQPTSTLFVSTITRAEIELGIALLPDGKRKRRFSADRMKRKWYSLYRSLRFRRRFVGQSEEVLTIHATWVRSQLLATFSKAIQ